MRICAICQVRNQTDLVPLFLGASTRLFDRILLIDHRSRIDLRGLQVNGVEVVRVDARPHLQVVYPNFLMKELGLDRDFDWVFGLDIDEFLLVERAELETILRQHRRAVYVRFHWQNAVFSAPEKTSPGIAWRFARQSHTQKVAANTQILRRFNFGHGFHRIKYGYGPKLNPMVTKSRVSTLPITHFPLGRDTGRYAAKAKQLTPINLKHTTFLERVTTAAPEHYRTACARIVEGTDSFDDRMLFAAYYSDAHTDGVTNAIDPSDIEEVPMAPFVDPAVMAAAEAFFESAAEAGTDSAADDNDFTEAEQALIDMTRSRPSYFTTEMAGALTYDRHKALVTMAR